METTATMKDSVADSGPSRKMKRFRGRRRSPPREEKRHRLFNRLISSWMYVDKIALLGSRKVYSI
jgi:hypothetical protein